MTEDEKRELFGRLDDIHGTQVGLAQVLAIVLTAATPQAREVMKTHLAQADVGMEAVRLNSRYPDRVLEVAENVYQQLTRPLR